MNCVRKLTHIIRKAILQVAVYLIGIKTQNVNQTEKQNKAPLHNSEHKYVNNKLSDVTE